MRETQQDKEEINDGRLFFIIQMLLPLLPLLWLYFHSNTVLIERIDIGNNARFGIGENDKSDDGKILWRNRKRLCLVYLKILPWLNLRPLLSVPVQEK